MSKKSFLPRTDLDKQIWLQNLAAKIALYASKYNLSAADIAKLKAAALYFAYWLDYQNQFNEYTKKITAYKNELRDGVPAGAEPSTEPVAPLVEPPPPAAAPGIFVFAASIGNIIKKNTAYTVADGNDLGIEGAEITIDLQSKKPVITIRLVDGGKPELVWQKSGMDGIEIFVDRGDGRWQFLAIDTYPNYIDTTPLSDTVSSAVWNYKCIYRYDDAQTGQWSDVATVTVSR